MIRCHLHLRRRIVSIVSRSWCSASAAVDVEGDSSLIGWDSGTTADLRETSCSPFMIHEIIAVLQLYPANQSQRLPVLRAHLLS